ncbi:protease B nonderepressible form [Sporothrix curviconia]|uniref:Protein PBN1 n=1 Tax=Sporothrix curviconia TaxID=1260050 RepID=A0ABP0B7T1_9PEZI
MRVRTTFFHRPESPVDPALLRVGATLTGPAIDAAREDRVTISLDDVPPALARVLSDSVQELHVRWAARTAGAEPVGPLLSRVSPGLHVFYTPAPGTSEEKQDAVCTLLRSLFGSHLDCQSVKTSFNYVGDDSQTHQFYAAVDSLAPFAACIKADWCPSTAEDGGLCGLRASQLDGASALDLSYDAYSRNLKVTTQWPLAEWPLFVTALAGPNDRTEVGIMGSDQPSTLGLHELAMSGVVAVLAQDDRAKPVMFAFPSRHRTALDGASFSAALTEPTGLHPTLQLRVTPGPPPRNPEDDGGGACRLHTYLTLPRHIFADRYQLGDALFLASKNLTALHHMTQPVDLEAPDYAVNVWGSAALIELAPPAAAAVSVSGSGSGSGSGQAAEFTAEIPLHLRYLLPAAGGYRTVELPYPTVFWACEAGGDQDVQFASNPFDRVNLGYDALFDETTEFWHVQPAPRSTDLVLPIRVPVLDSNMSQWVNIGTSAAILVGFSWVLWKLLAVYLRTGYGRPAAVKPTKKTQ